MRSPIRTGAEPKHTALLKEETTEIFFFFTGIAVIPEVAPTNAAICPGVVPQQPPTIRSPSFTSSAVFEANSSGETSKTVTPF